MHLQAPWQRQLTRWPVIAYAGKLLFANITGGVVVLLLVLKILPLPTGVTPLQLRHTDNLYFIAFLPAAAVLMLGGGLLVALPILRWTARGGPPTGPERRATLQQPLRQLAVQVTTWIGGVAVFVPATAHGGPQLMTLVGMTIAMGGSTACAVAYVMGERELRGLVALASAYDSRERWRTAGVTARVMVIWGFSTGIPVLGVLLLAAPSVLGMEPGTEGSIAPAVSFLSTLALVCGCIGMMYVVRSIADPIRQVSDAMRRVEDGDTTARVNVYDGSEVGRLQAGFNSMVTGLREREMMRDLLSKHVGEDVARHAVEGGAQLGGEVVDVAVLFTDITGSTGLAEAHSPDDVVVMLNEFFRVVVDVVDEHGGFINKFEGDAALAVFGAPEGIVDPAGAALSAARELRTRLSRQRLPDAGIGVSSGPVVAGYIGADERFEYTVIGDPVNEASRLTDLAKHRRGRVLASQRTIDAAGLSEASHWRLRERVTVRGRSARTRLATPRRSSYPPDVAGMPVG